MIFIPHHNYISFSLKNERERDGWGFFYKIHIFIRWLVDYEDLQNNSVDAGRLQQMVYVRPNDEYG